MKKIRESLNSVRVKLFLTLSLAVIVIIVFLIILNNFVLETYYLLNKQKALFRAKIPSMNAYKCDFCERIFNIMTLKYNNNYDSSDSSILLLHVTGAHEQDDLDHEFQLIKKFSGRDDFQLMSVAVNDWNQDLAPWSAPPVFGAEPFGDGAGQTLQRILEIPMPETRRSGRIGTDAPSVRAA